jgi:ABC-type glycerol-3-phosphate transport system permease component
MKRSRLRRRALTGFAVLAAASLGLYVGLDVSNWSALASSALFVVVPIMVLTAVSQRGLVRGITAGGLIG